MGRNIFPSVRGRSELLPVTREMERKLTPVIDRLEHVRRIMIKIAANRSDGRNYIPIIQHLEKHIQMQRGSELGVFANLGTCFPASRLGGVAIFSKDNLCHPVLLPMDVILAPRGVQSLDIWLRR